MLLPLHPPLKLAAAFLLLALSLLSIPAPAELASDAEKPAASPEVLSLRALPVEKSTSGEVACATPDSLYVGLRTYNREQGGRLRLWRVEPEGDRLWDLLLTPEHGGGLGYNLRSLHPQADGGVRVFYTDETRLKVTTVSLDGKMGSVSEIDACEFAQGVLALANGDLLVFGEKTSPNDSEHHLTGYVARHRTDGAIRWQRSFAGPGRELYLYAGKELADGSLLLVGNAGEFTKFGQGPSRQWLQRLSADGDELNHAEIPGGRLFPMGSDQLAATRDSILVPHTTGELPPMGNVPMEPRVSDLKLTRFSYQLQSLGEVSAPGTMQPGAILLSGGPPFWSMGAGWQDLTISLLTAEGRPVRTAQLTGDHFHPVSLLPTKPGRGLAVANFTRYALKPGETERSYLILAEIATTPQP